MADPTIPVWGSEVTANVALEQWNGLYPCRFTPSAETKREHSLHARGHYCLIPRLGYLYFSVNEILAHFFESLECIADRHIFFEIVTKRGRLSIQEYYPLGVILDLVEAAQGAPVDFLKDGFVNIEFTLLVALTQQNLSHLCCFNVMEARRFGQLQLQQQQKAACSAMFGSTAPLVKTSPHVFRGLQDSIAQNNAHQFFLARGDVWERGLQELERFPARSSRGPYGVFLFHHNNVHITRCLPLKEFPTLASVLADTIPECHDWDDDSSGATLSESPKRSTHATTTGTKSHMNAEEQQRHSGNALAMRGGPDGVKILLTGVCPLLSTPSDFLVSNLSGGDFCVHLTVVGKVSKGESSAAVPASSKEEVS